MSSSFDELRSITSPATEQAIVESADIAEPPVDVRQGIAAGAALVDSADIAAPPADIRQGIAKGAGNRRAPTSRRHQMMYRKALQQEQAFVESADIAAPPAHVRQGIAADFSLSLQAEVCTLTLSTDVFNIDSFHLVHLPEADPGFYLRGV